MGKASVTRTLPCCWKSDHFTNKSQAQNIVLVPIREGRALRQDWGKVGEQPRFKRSSSTLLRVRLPCSLAYKVQNEPNLQGLRPS